MHRILHVARDPLYGIQGLGPSSPPVERALVSQINFSQFRALGPEELNSLDQVVPHVLEPRLLDASSDIGQLNEHLVQMRRLVLPVAFCRPEASFESRRFLPRR